MQIDPSQVLWSAPEAERAGRPLLVMLHGHRLDETMGADLRHRLPTELVVASIRAPMEAGGGFAWFRLDATVGVQQAAESAQAILRWLDTVPPAPSVGLLGFSQGAATGIQVMRSAARRFAYAVLLSGFVVPGPAIGDQLLSRTKPPVFWGRGDRDPLIPDFLVSLTSTWLTNHTTLTEHVYPGLGHNVADAELNDLHDFLATQIDRSGSARSET